MTNDLKKKMDDLEKNREDSPEADAAYQQARSDWQGSEVYWRKIERGEKIPEDPKPEPKPKPPKKKPKPENGLLPFPEDGDGE